MDEIVCSLRNRFSLVLFLIFSVIFIISGIPSVFNESMLYGSGYYMSFEFFKTVLLFVPFIAVTLFVFLLVKQKYVLVFSEAGILDRRLVLIKLFIPWDDVISAEIKEKRKNRPYLYLKLQNHAKYCKDKNGVPKIDELKISLHNLEFDVMRLNDLLIRKKV